MKMKEINFFMADIYSSYKRDKAIFFLGSGFSLNFKVKSWEDFLESMLNEINNELEENKENSIFGDTNRKTKRELNEVLKKIKTKTININYALEIIYIILGIKVDDDCDEKNIKKINFIKKIYEKFFKLDQKKDMVFDMDMKLIEEISSYKKKVITTNYDNLLFLNKPKEKLNKIFNSFYVNSKYDKIELENEFYFSIHGSILNESFLDYTKSPWQTYYKEDSNYFQFPIVDSFSTFQKAYGINRENISNLLKKVIWDAFLNDYKIIFFGYSFNDYFVSKEIMDIIIDIEGKSLYSKNFIYIFRDDIEDKIIRKLNILDYDEDFKPLIETELVRYIDFSDVIDYREKSSFEIKYETELSTLKDKVKNYKNYEVFKEDKNIDLVYKIIKRESEVKHILKNTRDAIIPYILEVYRDFKDLNINQIFGNIEINEQFKEIFHLTYLYRIIGYNEKEIFKKYFNSKSSYISKDIGTYYYSILYVYELELIGNEEIFKEFLESYEQIEGIKLPNYKIEFKNIQGLKKFIKENELKFEEEWWNEFDY